MPHIMNRKQLFRKLRVRRTNVQWSWCAMHEEEEFAVFTIWENEIDNGVTWLTPDTPEGCAKLGARDQQRVVKRAIELGIPAYGLLCRKKGSGAGREGIGDFNSEFMARLRLESDGERYYAIHEEDRISVDALVEVSAWWRTFFSSKDQAHAVFDLFCDVASKLGVSSETAGGETRVSFKYTHDGNRLSLFSGPVIALSMNSSKRREQENKDGFYIVRESERVDGDQGNESERFPPIDGNVLMFSGYTDINALLENRSGRKDALINASGDLFSKYGIEGKPTRGDLHRPDLLMASFDRGKREALFRDGPERPGAGPGVTRDRRKLQSASAILLEAIDSIEKHLTMLIGERSQGDLLEELVDPTLGKLVKVCADLYRKEMPETLREQLSKCVEIRNRVVHNFFDAKENLGEIADDWYRFQKEFVDWAVKEVPALSTKTGPDEEEGNVAGEVRPVYEGTIWEELYRDNSNVAKLAGFLDTKLKKEHREDLLQELYDEGLRGNGSEMNDNGILSEYCFSKDPVDIMSSHFNVYELRRSVGGIDAGSKGLEECAKILLKEMGFNIPVSPSGIEESLKVVRTIGSRFVLAQNKDDMLKEVHPTAIELEKVLDRLIIFYGNLLWGEDYEEVFAEWDDEFSRKRSLGTKNKLLLKCEKTLRREKPLQDRLSIFDRDFIIGKDELKRIEKIIPIRNDFSHFNEEAAGWDFARCREKVKQIIDVTCEFIEYLKEEDVFPKVIRVDESVVDRYGRKYFRCVTEDGTSERIYTSLSIDVQNHYFFVPRTNPARVNPVLIAFPKP
jgi:hypothetical protein